MQQIAQKVNITAISIKHLNGRESPSKIKEASREKTSQEISFSLH
jgi:hypothetical protein